MSAGCIFGYTEAASKVNQTKQNMPYLIDGHNLIGQLPDIDLADPHDEAKLVLKLRSFCARTGKQVTVVFDKGIPSGFDRSLSNGKVKVRFASVHSTADDVLRSIIRGRRNAPGWTVVSSDNEVTAMAIRRKMRVIKSQEFARDLTKILKDAPTPAEAMKRNPRLTKAEVEEWLAIFGGAED